MIRRGDSGQPAQQLVSRKREGFVSELEKDMRLSNAKGGRRSTRPKYRKSEEGQHR